MFNFIRKIRYWFKYRKQPKLFVLRKHLSVEEIKILYPDKLPPLIAAVELLKENHVFRNFPEFKFFPAPITELDKRLIKLQEEIMDYHKKGPKD